jgi:hypothetical protein
MRERRDGHGIGDGEYGFVIFELALNMVTLSANYVEGCFP